MNSSEQSKLVISLPEVSFPLYVIKQGVKVPRTLHFERLFYPNDSDSMRNPTSASSISEFIIAPPESPTSSKHYDFLITLFTTSQGSHCSTMAEFSDTEDPLFTYILTLSTSLGTFPGNRSLSFSKYRLKDLLMNDIRLLSVYVTDIKSLKSLIYKKYISVNRQLKKSSDEHSKYTKIYTKLLKKLKSKEKQLKETNPLLEQLKFQLEQQTTRLLELDPQHFECLLCRGSFRDIVMRPCGHVVVCKTCITDKMGLDIGRRIKRSKKIDCPLCKNRVEEALQIIY